MKYLFIIFVSLFSMQLYSQQTGEVSPDPRLFARYQTEYIQSLLQSDANIVAFMNYELDFGYAITDVGVEKASTLPPLYFLNTTDKTQGIAVAEIDEMNVNIMLYDFERKYDMSVAYRIGNTGKVISFTSLKQLNKEFNQE